MATNRVDSVKDNVFKLPSRINSTWGGNLIDMVRCTKFLEIIEEDNLVNNAATVGGYFLGQLHKLQEKYPQSLTNVRGKGLMIAFDTFTSEYSSKVVGAAYKKQLIILTCGTQSVRFRPPLDMTKKNVDDLIAILDSVFIELGPDRPAKL
jgi:L-lysine 6-transaminase